MLINKLENSERYYFRIEGIYYSDYQIKSQYKLFKHDKYRQKLLATRWKLLKKMVEE
jgi:hypothetical protein